MSNQHQRRRAIVHDTRAFSAAKFRQCALEVDAASAPCPGIQVDLEIVVIARRVIDRAQRFICQWDTTQVCVDKNAGAVDDRLQSGRRNCSKASLICSRTFFPAPTDLRSAASCVRIVFTTSACGKPRESTCSSNLPTAGISRRDFSRSCIGVDPARAQSGPRWQWTVRGLAAKFETREREIFAGRTTAIPRSFAHPLGGNAMAVACHSSRYAHLRFPDFACYRQECSLSRSAKKSPG